MVIVGATRMLSAAQQIVDVSIPRGSEADPTPSYQTDTSALWSHRHISQLPSEVLSHIFGCLDCDDIVQVNNTCEQFRKVVQACHTQALWFNRLPQRFRQHFPKSRSWLKQMMQDGLHPFTIRLPARESEFLNAQQQAAVVCFHAMKEMMSTSRYHPREVFACRNYYRLIGVHYAQINSNFVIYSQLSHKMSLLSQNDSGSWSEQVIYLDESCRSLPLSPDVSFSANRRYLSVFGSGDLIHIYRRGSEAWQLVSRQRVETAYLFKVSPSGKYLFIASKTDGIGGISCFDDQDSWNPMPLATEVRINTHVRWAAFSPSEQHLLIRQVRKLVILSLDSRGCWNLTWQTRRVAGACVRFSYSEQHVAIRYKHKVVVLSLDSRGRWKLLWEMPSDRKINCAWFCPSGSWLLIAYRENGKCGSVAEMIKFNPAGKCRSQQINLPRYFDFTFSHGGDYLLVSNRSRDQHLLWVLLKSDQWVLYGDLNAPGALPWPGLGQTELRLSTAMFSSCDNHLFTSTRDGAVTIWGLDEQGSWVARGSEHFDSVVKYVRFSRSGVHALAVYKGAIHIWGRDDGGLWSVKGIIQANDFNNVDFHPSAEHLIICWHSARIRIWEIQRRPEVGSCQKGKPFFDSLIR